MQDAGGEIFSKKNGSGLYIFPSSRSIIKRTGKYNQI